MSHATRYLVYHCSVSENQILKDLNEFAYDPQETYGYHGNMKFHRDIVCKSEEEAIEKIKELDKGWYGDHAVFFRYQGKKFWLVKVEYHI